MYDSKQVDSKRSGHSRVEPKHQRDREKTVDLKHEWVYIHECHPKKAIFQLCNFAQPFVEFPHHTWAEAHLKMPPV
jgi:hypothetical protein